MKNTTKTTKAKSFSLTFFSEDDGKTKTIGVYPTRAEALAARPKFVKKLASRWGIDDEDVTAWLSELTSSKSNKTEWNGQWLIVGKVG